MFPLEETKHTRLCRQNQLKKRKKNLNSRAGIALVPTSGAGAGVLTPVMVPMAKVLSTHSAPCLPWAHSPTRVGMKKRDGAEECVANHTESAGDGAQTPAQESGSRHRAHALQLQVILGGDPCGTGLTLGKEVTRVKAFSHLS